jgi:pyruvate dehydrogenase E1 component alpha subunit
MAMAQADWLFPSYRDGAAAAARGMPLDAMVAYWMGHPRGGIAPAGVNVFPFSIPVGSHIPHAAGMAWAARLRGEDACALCLFGDGATSEGDFHEGLNFAGIHRLPVVFVVENNGYAISVPMSLQSPIPNIADRAVAYGFPGVVVDGGDVLACYRAGRDAIDRARRGDGPTLIEAKVTRLTAHSSDDQQTKYRSAEELQAERERDALPRFRTQLRDAGVLDDAREAEITADVKAAVNAATEWAEAQPEPDPSTAFRHVYAEEDASTTPEAIGGPGFGAGINAGGL